MAVKANTQTFTILAQDPAIESKPGQPLFARVSVPAEYLAEGPTGYRVKVVDFDASANYLYASHRYQRTRDKLIDPFDPPSAKVLKQPAFHCQHVYAVVMRTLARFEMALGRRVAWGFGAHQLHIVPHAFVDANAFYSREDRALMFGYFHDGKDWIYTCLSHDIVAHEATHAVLDGLRGGFMNASGPDQAAFHEGFADVVALLSVFSLREVVEFSLAGYRGADVIQRNGTRLIQANSVRIEALAKTLLFGIGKQFGQALSDLRANALRRSVELEPATDYLTRAEYSDPHSRGEILVAAMMRSLLALWSKRIASLGTFDKNHYSLDAVIDEGVKAADQLLTIAIRALDYSPPLDLEFGDYLAALLTVDAEVAPDDSRYSYRQIIRDTFKSYGIKAPPQRTDQDGCWKEFTGNENIRYHNSHFDSMLRDSQEVFRFLWENRDALGIDFRLQTEVTSVRPSLRIGPDGLLLRETVCEYISQADLYGSELDKIIRMPRPDWLETTREITLYGAGTLIFDQYGRIKYHIQRHIRDASWQQRRIEWLYGPGTEGTASASHDFAAIHRLRVTQPPATKRGGQSS
ncbi:MAG: hypothetical protein LBJ37_15585 [Paucimonas sp.]|jgi:hypothetical protein|nr:hypothetical protein [Paucimonas sp.]